LTRLPAEDARARRGRRAHSDAKTVRGDAQERWPQILEAATHLFRTKGFASTSMQEISDAVGLLKGSLYYYISSKENLLFEILNGLHKDGEELIASIKFGSADPLRELHLYFKGAIIFAALNADRLAIFLRDFHYIPAERQREIISEREMYANAVHKLVTEAKAKGLTSPHLDVSIASTLIVGAVSSTHEWLRKDAPRPLYQAAEEIARMLVNTLRDTGAPRAAKTAPKKRKATKSK
jgi:AcrR family transcriptional regulator